MANSPSFFQSYGNSLISGGAGIISGLFGALGQNIAINKQIKAQQEENEKNRTYNFNLAQLQNKWNLEQWNRENEYNSPAQQMARLKAAGLNPDMMYQNGTSGLTAASSPSMTAGAPSSPVDMSALGQKRTIGDAVHQGLQDSLLGAQIDLMRSEANKNNKEAGLTESRTRGQDLTNQNILALDSAEVQRRLSTAGLNNKQIEVSTARIDEINQHIKEMAENVKYMYQLRQNASEQQTLNWFYYEFDRQDRALRNALGWQEYNQAKQLFRYTLESAKHTATLDEYVAKLQKETYDLFLKSPEHYSVEWFHKKSPETKDLMFNADDIMRRLSSGASVLESLGNTFVGIKNSFSKPQPRMQGSRTVRYRSGSRNYTDTHYIY